MKVRPFCILLFLFLAFPISFWGQQVGQEQADTASVVRRSARRNGYAALEGSYYPMLLDIYDLPQEKTILGHAFAVSFLRGIELSRRHPLYIETGLSLQRIWYGYKYSGNKEQVKFISLVLPVRLSYRFRLNRNLFIQPYAGLRLRGSLSGEVKITNRYKEPFYTDLFDEAKIGERWTRFQLGVQVGASLVMDGWFCSLGLGRELTPLVDDGHKSTFPCSYVGVGVYLK